MVFMKLERVVNPSPAPGPGEPGAPPVGALEEPQAASRQAPLLEGDSAVAPAMSEERAGCGPRSLVLWSAGVH